MNELPVRPGRQAWQTLVVTFTLACFALTACEGFGSQARAAREVLDETSLPADFTAAGTRYPGNTQDTPVRRFTAPPGTRLLPSAIEVPKGYERDVTAENQLRNGALGRRLVGYWVGPSPLGSGECNILVTVVDAKDEPGADVQVACVLGQ
jgi:hypothetical protein